MKSINNRGKSCVKWEYKLQVSKTKKTARWELKDIQYVFENLKKKKYRDTLGYSNELFQLGGSDFVKAIQMCMNNVKDQHTNQECFKDCKRARPLRSLCH